MSNEVYSISKINTFFSCPQKYKLNYIDKIKIKKPIQIALYKGNYCHKVLENNFDYDTDFKTNEIFTEHEKQKAIKIVKTFKETELGELVQKLIRVSNLEENFAFNSDLELSGYWDKKSLIRGSADLYTNPYKDKVIIVDYKTGKDHSEQENFGYDQALVYSIFMFIKFKDIKKVTAKFIFIEHSTFKDITFYKDKLEEYFSYIKDKIDLIESEKHFKCNVTALCDYCDFKGTHCFEPDRLKNMKLDDMTLDF